MPMTRRETQIWLEQALESITPSYKAEAKLVMTSVLNCSPLDLLIEKEKRLSEAEWARIQQIADRRSFHEPLQYILGEQGFMGHLFAVSPDVLIPRPETETLVEWVIARLEERIEKAVSDRMVRVLDIGTGSGAIAVSIARAVSKAEVVGVDISEAAVKTAEYNARKNDITERVTFGVSDLFSAVSKEMRFDIIVSNPPYIPETDRETLQREVRLFEPEMALFGGEDGLDFYRKIIPDARAYLVPGGILVFEAGHNQMPEIEAMFVAFGYGGIGHFEDLCGIPRFIYGILEER
ncbi:MAG: release factor glutamine methyltransferase [Clostridiales bacterium]|nr:release factor glutamine methyltransferase [Clostridiales bacterium]